MKRLLPLAVVLVAAGIAALAVNLLLVDYASGRDDPVGKLSPRATLPAPAATQPTRPGTTTTRGATTTEDEPVETGPTTTDDGDSSGRGRGRNRGRGGDGSSDDD